MSRDEAANAREKSAEALAQVVLKTAGKLGFKIACAESLTGGRLADALVSVPGASAVFLGGMVTYTDAIKTKLLGIDPELLETKTAYCPEVASQMAAAIRDIYGADIGVSSTGVAGPGSDRGVLPGTGFVGVVTADTAKVMPIEHDGKRNEVRDAFVTGALTLILDCLTPAENVRE